MKLELTISIGHPPWELPHEDAWTFQDFLATWVCPNWKGREAVVEGSLPICQGPSNSIITLSGLDECFVVGQICNALSARLPWPSFTRNWRFRYQDARLCLHSDGYLELSGILIFTKNHVLLYLSILAQENAGYLIKNQHGFLESFEREYYDLIRSAFLKYR
jgi:hypothetical protein